MRRTMNLTRSRSLALIFPSSDKSIKLVSFHSGDGFVFLNFPLAWIVDQPSAYPASIRRFAAIAASITARIL
jgi:hypothetical protein